MLSLEDFVKASLEQIVRGVQQFNTENKEAFATTSPTLSGGTNTKEWAGAGIIITGYGTHDELQYASMVDFDVAVTAEESDKAKAGGGITVATFFKAEAGIEEANKNASVSRIKFRLPLQVNTTPTKRFY
ncbi:hypothetical protein [Hwanghaeella sp. LZ110]|uniref:hypothetical protein n=1 Tax=Hwanghaeella sp. LZ110 TaxID=3402810 RepID=UPI003B68243A